MLVDNHNDELDNLIDQALASYGTEPSAGLEAKIIAAARSTPVLVRMTPSTLWSRTACGVAAASILAVLLLHDAGTSQQPGEVAPTARPRSIMARQQVQINPNPAGEPVAFEPHWQSRSETRSRVRPKTDYTAPGMTEEERMLAELASQHPQQTLSLIAMNEEQSHPLTVEPIRTQPLKIEPIHIDSLSNSNPD